MNVNALLLHYKSKLEAHTGSFHKQLSHKSNNCYKPDTEEGL